MSEQQPDAKSHGTHQTIQATGTTRCLSLYQGEAICQIEGTLLAERVAPYAVHHFNSKSPQMTQMIADFVAPKARITTMALKLIDLETATKWPRNVAAGGSPPIRNVPIHVEPRSGGGIQLENGHRVR